MANNVLFLGSIGAVSETSEIQRQSYNDAFDENGVGWHWEPDTYRQLLQSSGGIQRMELLSAAANQGLTEETIHNVHARKTALAGERVVAQGISPRAGIVDLIAAARAAGAKVAWVTTTSKDNTDALLNAAGDELNASDFDHIFHREDAPEGKPAPDIYEVALRHFDAKPEDCLAVEDSFASVLAAKRAGIPVVATLGKNHQGVNVDRIADWQYDSAAEINTQRLFTR